MLYRGDIKKAVPVFVKRLACLADKPERADYTGTLSYASKFHRCFGTIIDISPPQYQSDAIDQFLDKLKARSLHSGLKYGWSYQFLVKRSGLNGEKLPACKSCRKDTVEAILHGATFPVRNCQRCANWVLSRATAGKLHFPPPKAYPKTQFANSPVC